MKERVGLRGVCSGVRCPQVCECGMCEGGHAMGIGIDAFGCRICECSDSGSGGWNGVSPCCILKRIALEDFPVGRFFGDM